MFLVFLSLIISAAVVIFLIRGRPNLFVFELIERVFDRNREEVTEKSRK